MIVYRETPRRPVPKRGPKPVITLNQRIVEARSPQQIRKERGDELRTYKGKV